MPRQVELSDFASRVEQVCDFFLDKATRNGTPDVMVLEELKEDAANIQADNVVSGLYDYMRGLKKE